MGQYLQHADVVDAIGPKLVKRALDENTDGFPDLRAYDRLIDDSEAILNGDLRGIYELPLQAPIDPLVVTVCTAILRWLLAERHGAILKRDPKPLKATADEFRRQLREHDLQLNHPLNAGAGIPDVYSDTNRGYGLINDPTAGPPDPFTSGQ